MIEIAAVSKRFKQVEALHEVSLRIEPGARVALVGHNGSGKTTLLRCILGLLRHSGVIRRDGIDVAREPERALRQLAYVPQVAPPLEALVRDLLRVYSDLHQVKFAAVRERAERFDFDLAAHLHKRFRDLSGGSKQKLLAALALASPATVLVCDEPTANLDPAARASFFEQVAERPITDTVILSSHRYDEVRALVRRVIEFRDGVVHRDAAAGELFTAMPAYVVEVTLAESAAVAARWLIDAGFSASGRQRFSARLTQEEKLRVVQTLVREHEAELRDLSVYEEGSLALARNGERLRVVS